MPKRSTISAIALTFSVFLLPTASKAFGSVVATCGAAKGYSYYVPSQLVSADNAGLPEDGISNGVVQLYFDGDRADILFVDSFGKLISATED